MLIRDTIKALTWGKWLGGGGGMVSPAPYAKEDFVLNMKVARWPVVTP